MPLPRSDVGFVVVGPETCQNAKSGVKPGLMLPKRGT